MTTIRQATTADVELVESITAAAYSGYIDAMRQTPGPMLADFAADVAAGSVWVTHDCQAAITMLADGADWHIASVAVHPDSQGEGLGRRLMAFAEEVAAERGHDRITLYTHIAMTRPAALYPRLGYGETGRRTVDGFDRIYFAKQL